jgi:dienelactone hydrolase
VNVTQTVPSPSWLVLLILFLFPLTAEGALVTQAVEYRDGETLLEGYLAYDDSIEGKRPGVLVVHEWKGLNDYARSRADKLAQLGYVAFAVDMYGKGILAKDHEEAAKLSGVYRNDRSLMRERASAGLEVLKNHPLTDPTRIAAIGYCFGGTTVLELARAGSDLKGVVTFHGGLDAPVATAPGTVKAKILVLHGAQDSHITPDQVAQFEKEMTEAGADWQLVKFSGAVHGFTVPGPAHHPDADRRSWQMMKHFFEEIFASLVVSK